MKKKVIAYVHTHWDREWYREFEVFRLRLLRVFDNVLDLLEQNKVPSFYFDGQTAALPDYLEIRPEKETLVRKLIAQKKLFIGPFYCLIDEFLTDRTCFSKNLEIGMEIARNFGCTDFIGYLADTFGHSKNAAPVLLEHGIDKCMVWSGCPASIPSEFTFNGINTVNMVRGYFNGIFSMDTEIEKKAGLIEAELNKIAEKSGDILLLPIGADHLGVEPDISEQINQVNAISGNYEITLSNPFEYFELVKDNFKNSVWNDELRDNSATFILPGNYSARMDLKQYNAACTYKLGLANRLQENYGNKYAGIIKYAYKLLLQNQAHDGICGCSTDLVHRENITRYEKILQIANTIVEELKLTNDLHTCIFESPEVIPGAQVISTRQGFESALLHDTQRIPVTEDCKELYLQIKDPGGEDVLSVSDNEISNSHIKLKVEENKINILNICGKKYKNFIEFVRYQDKGDAYNFGAVKNDTGVKAEIKSSKAVLQGGVISGMDICTDFFDVNVTLRKNSKLLNFKVDFLPDMPDTLRQVKFNLPEPVTVTFSEDMNTLIERHFDPDYEIRENLPEKRGLEAKTNTAPMQRFVWAQGFGVITKGLTEYEVKGNSLLITLHRSFGVISNLHNPCRTTPAGPPIPVLDAQHAGNAEFSIGFFDKEDYQQAIEEVFS
ncbi:MAG: hypothetical protein LBK53_02130 [Heliobacteriaceae bacterium]|jgi:hypothetical protein|nr:hypothetical protein [Heliobacteriaceae bacterium]